MNDVFAWLDLQTGQVVTVADHASGTVKDLTTADLDEATAMSELLPDGRAAELVRLVVGETLRQVWPNRDANQLLDADHPALPTLAGDCARCHLAVDSGGHQARVSAAAARAILGDLAWFASVAR